MGPVAIKRVITNKIESVVDKKKKFYAKLAEVGVSCLEAELDLIRALVRGGLLGHYFPKCLRHAAKLDTPYRQRYVASHRASQTSRVAGIRERRPWLLEGCGVVRFFG